MKKLIPFFILLVLISCNDEKDELCFNVDHSIEFVINDLNNVDLLNPSNQNAISEENIKIYNLLNGEKKYFYQGHLAHPKGFSIFKHENEYRLRLFIYAEPNESNITTTYIEWNENDTDTITCEMNQTRCSDVIIKTWVNGTLKWEASSGERLIYLIK